MNPNDTGPAAALIKKRLEERGGWLPFSDFMDLALFAPGVGYYQRGGMFGEQGDFVTAVDLGPWLALGLADLVRESWRMLGSPRAFTLMELGGGTGRLMAELARLLAKEGIEPELLAIERSGELARMQRQRLKEAGFCIEVVPDLESVALREPMVVFSNEFFDALPVRCFVAKRAGGAGIVERGVAWRDGRFVWSEAHEPLERGPAIAPEIRAEWPEGYISEWRPELSAWLTGLADCAERLVVLTVDYGYPQREYYRPGRIEGTLMGHAGHRVVHDVLSAPGSMDITAHVDFTAFARAGERAGMHTLHFMNQGAWLAQSPSVQQAIRDRARNPSPDSVQALAHARRLLMPDGMGESFKLLVQAKGVAGKFDWLTGFDRSHALEAGA